ncbi:MAG TPA: tripartite tricarboxylate transporter substrate binding protein [Burkholderiaceae bacterium]|nr:tripartite tricarboxylate transporter substrate binding protein [Burkholderiaceae bacterium]
MNHRKQGTRMGALNSAFVAASALVGGVALSTPAFAQKPDYPSKPIRIVVPFPPGGGNDILARAIAPRLHAELGQPIIVENKPGAGGNLATELVARAEPDGYSILIASNQVTINPALDAKLRFDLERDFAPIGMVASVPIVLVAHPGQPFKTLPEFMAFAKANPNKLNYSSPGAGTPQHLAGELYAHMSASRMVHVAYKGTGPALTDLIGGQVQISFATLASVMQYIQGGQLRPIAVAGERRAAQLPDLPTFVEAGLKGYEAALWYSLLVPANTPSVITTRLSAALQKALTHPATRERLIAQGFEPQTSTTEELAQRIKQDLARWARVVKEAGIKLEH